jgi:hypothetical protein
MGHRLALLIVFLFPHQTPTTTRYFLRNLVLVHLVHFLLLDKRSDHLFSLVWIFRLADAGAVQGNVQRI